MATVRLPPLSCCSALQQHQHYARRRTRACISDGEGSDGDADAQERRRWQRCASPLELLLCSAAKQH